MTTAVEAKTRRCRLGWFTPAIEVGRIFGTA